jgi:hypothetical protein
LYYYIYRNDTLLVPSIENMTYTDTTVFNNVTYEYQITAVNKNGEGDRSNRVQAVPLPLPLALSTLQATALNGQVRLRWYHMVSPFKLQIIKYTIYRGLTAGTENQLISIGPVDSYLQSYMDANVTNGLTYYYMLTATNNFGEGPMSNEVNVTPSETIIKPTWCRTWYDLSVDDVRNIVQDSSGIYVLGSIQNGSTGIEVTILLKYSQNGDILWNRSWGNNSKANDIVLDPSAIYIVGTQLHGYSIYDAFLAKFDKDGNLLWNRTWGGIRNNYANTIVVDSSAIYMSGTDIEIGKYGDNRYDGFLVKFDLDGNLLWNLSWSDENDYWVNDIVGDSTGLYITGYKTFHRTEDYNVFLIKYNLNGYLLWNRTWGGPSTDWASSIIVEDAAIFVTGVTNSYGNGLDNAFLNKYDPKGNLLWSRVWGGPNTDDAFSISGDSSSIYIAGYTNNEINYNQVFVVRYDLNGNMLWNRTWPGLFLLPRSSTVKAYGISNDELAIYITGMDEWEIFLLRFEK